MIHQNAIIEWMKNAPWSEMRFIEQDMVISRALISIFNDELLSSKLAFRGGTAIHKLFLKPQLRYSEDIDLIQIYNEPIGQVFDKIKEVLSFLDKPSIKQKHRNNTLIYQFDVEEPKGIIAKLKIEINCREHFNVYDMETHHFSMDNQWFTGSCNILTYRFEELIGTKMRALYQRKKGRDLFDIYMALNKEIDVSATINCYKKYMTFLGLYLPTADEYIDNLENKIADINFQKDLIPFLAKDLNYDVHEAYETVKERILVYL